MLDDVINDRAERAGVGVDEIADPLIRCDAFFEGRDLPCLIGQDPLLLRNLRVVSLLNAGRNPSCTALRVVLVRGTVEVGERGVPAVPEAAERQGHHIHVRAFRVNYDARGHTLTILGGEGPDRLINGVDLRRRERLTVDVAHEPSSQHDLLGVEAPDGVEPRELPRQRSLRIRQRVEVRTDGFEQGFPRRRGELQLGTPHHVSVPHSPVGESVQNLSGAIDEDVVPPAKQLSVEGVGVILRGEPEFHDPLESDLCDRVEAFPSEILPENPTEAGRHLGNRVLKRGQVDPTARFEEKPLLNPLKAEEQRVGAELVHVVEEPPREQGSDFADDDADVETGHHLFDALLQGTGHHFVESKSARSDGDELAVAAPVEPKREAHAAPTFAIVCTTAL